MLGGSIVKTGTSRLLKRREVMLKDYPERMQTALEQLQKQTVQLEQHDSKMKTKRSKMKGDEKDE